MKRQEFSNELNKDFYKKSYFENVEVFISKVEVLKEEKSITYLKSFHPSEIAAYIQILKKNHRLMIFRLLNDDFIVQILAELEVKFLKKIINEINSKIIEKALKILDSDDASKILEILDDDKKNRFLSTLKDANRYGIENNLKYSANTAGRLMQFRTVMVSKNYKVGDVIDYLRYSKNIPEIFYDIFVTDKKKNLLGSISLSKIVTCKSSTEVSKIMTTNFDQISVNFRLDQEEVADFFRKKNLTSVAVVDDNYKILGSIYVDDIVDVIDIEAQEDFLKLGGVSEQSFYDATISIVKSRFAWLLVNLLAAFFATLIIKNFENSIEKLAILAALMPVVASMGGCSGTQSLTTAVRAIAMKQLTLSNALRSTSKEVIIGSLNGFIFAMIGGIISFFLFSDIKISLIISFSLFINLIFGAFFGTFTPLILTKYGIDPAVASGTFVIMLTDIFGFFIFLSLATFYLI